MKVARFTQPNFLEEATKTMIPHMITIPYSHYCDMAVWSMEMTGKPFVEHGYMPGT